MKTFRLAVLACLIWRSDVPAQTPSYQGQTVTIRVGFTAGGAFDVWARIIAQHLGKHIPGNPTFIVQNMTGGGSRIAKIFVLPDEWVGPSSRHREFLRIASKLCAPAL